MSKLYIRLTGATVAAFAVLALWIPALDHAPTGLHTVTVNGQAYTITPKG